MTQGEKNSKNHALKSNATCSQLPARQRNGRAWRAIPLQTKPERDDAGGPTRGCPCLLTNVPIVPNAAGFFNRGQGVRGFKGAAFTSSEVTPPVAVGGIDVASD